MTDAGLLDDFRAVFEVAKILSATADIQSVSIALYDAQVQLPLELRTKLFESAVAASGL